MKNLNRKSHFFIAVMVGLSIPIFFAYLDIWELEIAPSFSNLFEVLKSQNIYLFSAFIFPILFMIVETLLYQIRQKSNYIEEEFEYLKVLLNATPDAIIFLNQDKEIIFQNNQSKLLFNNFDKVLDQTEIFRFFNQVEFIQKETLIDSNICENHPFLLNFKLAKFKDRKNYIVSLKDLKKLKDKEKIIEDQKHQMIEKNKLASLGEMAAGIAHEVNNPLTVINSNNSLIQRIINKDKIDLEKLNILTNKTKSQVERITAIITSLRNLSRGLANDDNEVFSLDQVIHETIALAKMRDKGKKIIFQFNNMNLHCYANRGQIVQVVLNLLNNAIDAIEDDQDPWIIIEIKDEEADRISLYITDSGNGIPDDIAAKIFIPMYTTKEVGKGTGLGLSLSRTFINQNDGTLDYLNNNGHTCFKIMLPKKDESHTQSA